MIACHELYSISARLAQITGMHDAPFGGMNVVLAGDFAQLSPVSVLFCAPRLPIGTDRSHSEPIGFRSATQFPLGIRVVPSGSERIPSDSERKLSARNPISSEWIPIGILDYSLKKTHYLYFST